MQTDGTDVIVWLSGTGIKGWNWIDNHFGLCESICSNVTFQISSSYRRKKSWTNRPEYRTLRYTGNDFAMVSISIIYLHIFFPILKVIINQFWILSLNFAYAANLAKSGLEESSRRIQKGPLKLHPPLNSCLITLHSFNQWIRIS